jgi:rod shape determining protein RodA
MALSLPWIKLQHRKKALMMNNAMTITSDLGLWGRIRGISWGLVALITMTALVGFVALYSAGGGNVDPWAAKHMIRFTVGAVMMLVVALIDIRIWYRLAWPIYFLCMGLLIVVEVAGHIGMGAQRWIDLGVIKLQPSEFMKIAVILMLARYFHAATLEDMRRLNFLIIPALIVVIPFLVVLIQPNLGTALKIAIVGTGMFFVAGTSLWLFAIGGVLAAISLPLLWFFVMHDYQKMRVLTFLNPESDPLGAGFNIAQSKIALGSGGAWGKGFLDGSQSRLNFLPEKETDFIFTLWAEEWGLLGGLFLLMLFALIFIYGTVIALRARQSFARYLAMGLTMNYSLYVFINVAMVMGMIPVVGVPLPLVSHGGTVMLAILFGFGLLLSCNLYRDSKVSRI